MSNRRSRQESQELTRRRLIEAGRVAFREHGFHRASAELISAKAGFTRGALYANFDGKEGLFLAVLDEEIDSRHAALSPPSDPQTNARRYCHLLDEERDWTLALLEFTVHAARHPTLAAELRARNETVRQLTHTFITHEYPDAGKEEVETAAKYLLALHSGIALERAIDPDSAGEAELMLGYRRPSDP